MRALWIEIPLEYVFLSSPSSRPVRALWIEISFNSSMSAFSMSRPVRALWIEMLSMGLMLRVLLVEAREGLVD